MRRFRIRPEDIVGDHVTFDPEETRHLRRVLRLGPGDIVEALDGAGTMLTVRIELVGPRGAKGSVLSRASHRTESPLRLTLAQGIAKGDKMETIIRMATELGVAPDGDAHARRLQRGMRIPAPADRRPRP